MTRILIVEDSPTQAEHLRQILDEAGFEVVWAADADAGLSEVGRGAFDLVVTDVTMPGVLDGVGLLRALRAEPATATLPVVVLSARAEEEARVEGLAAGADDYIVKPFAPRELLARIEGAIRLARLRGEVAAREQELEVARERVKLSLALEAARLGNVRYDLATGELSSTPAFAAQLGLPADRPLTLEAIREALHPDDRPDALALATAARTEAEYIDVEHRAVWPGGSVRHLAGRGHVARGPDGEPCEITLVNMDLTEKQETQMRIEHLQAEVAHAARLSELGRMSSVIAHELNQPLSAAASYLGAAGWLADASDGSAEKLRSAIRKAADQVTRAGEILQRIRDMAAKGSSERAAASLKQLLDEAVEVARLDPRARAVDLSIEVPSELPDPVVDRVQIQQVLLNLLRNAFEAVQSMPTRRVAVSAHAGEESIEICVADTGPGLAPQVAAELFKPFLTTKAHGMGIGLSVCREIVESHGGRIWADAAPGGGAAFRFTLPIGEAG
jgi:C4-dicarboxylate-specific signal transduction histidine kinase